MLSVRYVPVENFLGNSRLNIVAYLWKCLILPSDREKRKLL